MTPEQWEAICARDNASSMQDLRLFQSVKDRRELRKYVEELQARVKSEAAAKKEFERDWLKAIDAQGSAEAELAALKAAAGKVRCWRCWGDISRHSHNGPCHDCADLRELQAVVNSYPNHKEGCVCSFCRDAFDDARRVLKVTK